MKKTKLLTFMLISMMSACLAFAACSSGAETKYSLNKTEEALYVGDTVQLTVTAEPEKAVTPEWAATPATVVSVSETGLVTALGTGTATVTATVDGKTLSCAITVSERPIEYDYTLNHTTASVEKGETLQLSLSCEPERESMAVTWESTGSAATVNADGLVTAVSVGSADVNAKVNGAVVATCKVTVFEYVYSFAKSMTLNYGDNTKTLAVTVTPTKPVNISYEVADDDESVVSVSSNGAISATGVGNASVTVKDGESVLGTCAIKVQANITSVEEKVNLHAGGTHEIAVESSPAADTLEISCEIISGSDVISVSSGGRTLTALKSGEAEVKVTVDGREYYTDVSVKDVFGTAAVQKLEKDKNNPIDITAGAEYWEQYISSGEINHKHYNTVEEDIIERTCSQAGKYLQDYPAFLSWSGGGNPQNCDCGKCAKDAHTTPDGGWNGDSGTKAYAVDVKNAVISLAVKVFAGQSVIKVYTGGYNLVGELTLKYGGEEIAVATFDNRSAHNAQCVSFAVDSLAAADVVVEAVMTNDYNDNGNSCISIAAVTVSGNTYSLENKSARILTGGTTDIVLKKDGTALTEGVEYEVTAGADVASVDNATGVVTGLKDGTATVKVTADGRERYFTVNVGYEYSLENKQINLVPQGTHQISITSDPAGATVSATYESSDGNVATVNASGLITAVAAGTATVTVNVGSQTLKITVMVSNVTVTTRHEETANQIIDLTSSDIVYWEHYLYTELNPKAVDTEKGERDLIDGSIADKRGDGGSTTKFWYEGSSGPKETAISGDGAWHKYSWSDHFTFDITVPAGTHEIRVYTGVWKTENKTALYDGAVELASYTFSRTTDGINMLVAFSMTLDAEKTFTLKIDALSGDNNCRLNAIAIVDTSATDKTALTLRENETLDGKTVDLTADGIIDWATFGEAGHEKGGVDMIKSETLAQGAGTGNANDFKASFNIGETDPVSPFKFSDEYVSVQVGVDSTVKTMTVYMTGWNADYYLVVKDGDGRVLATVFVNKVDNQSVAKEIVFDVSAAHSDTLTVTTRKLSTSNCGIAAIVLGGETA